MVEIATENVQVSPQNKKHKQQNGDVYKYE
jgi:hypothetical protein